MGTVFWRRMSQTIRYPRGSEWRRWDLHLHTPSSALNNGFGDDFDSYARQLLERAVAEEIAVVGVTDYFGYLVTQNSGPSSQTMTDWSSWSERRSLPLRGKFSFYPTSS